MRIETALQLVGKQNEKVSSPFDFLNKNMSGGVNCFMTLEEVAKEFKVTRERVRAIERKALKKLFNNKEFNKILKEFL